MSQGLLKGLGSYCFEPDSSLTRAMFVTMLYRVVQQLGTTAEAGENVFTDVENGRWYTDAVLWAAKEGIVKGYGDGMFLPEQSINREEMCTILNRAAGKLRLGTVAGELKFADKDEISRWAKESVQAMVQAGLMKGMKDNRFAPKSTATRAEAATVLLRMTDLYQKVNAKTE